MNDNRKSKEYVLVLDTNQVFSDGEEDLTKLFNKNVNDLRSFIVNNKLTNVKLCIPEIVIQERITQRTKQTLNILEEFKNKHNKLKIFGVDISNLPTENNIREKLIEISKKLSNEQIIIYSIPNPSISAVIKRAYLKIKPFQDEGKGFKDAIIWYSIIENCKDKIIILISNDQAFDKDSLNDEFKGNCGRQLEVFKTLEDAKSFLRKEFNLDENIEKIHEQIKEEVTKEISNILFELIGKKYYSYRWTMTKTNKNMLIGGFFIKEIIFKNISENYAFIDLDVEVKAKLFESPEEKENDLYETAMYTDILKTPYWSPMSHILYPIEKNLIISIRLHKIKDNYQVNEHSIIEDYKV